MQNWDIFMTQWDHSWSDDDSNFMGIELKNHVLGSRDEKSDPTTGFLQYEILHKKARTDIMGAFGNSLTHGIHSYHKWWVIFQSKWNCRRFGEVHAWKISRQKILWSIDQGNSSIWVGSVWCPKTRLYRSMNLSYRLSHVLETHFREISLISWDFGLVLGKNGVGWDKRWIYDSTGP